MGTSILGFHWLALHLHLNIVIITPAKARADTAQRHNMRTAYSRQIEQRIGALGNLQIFIGIGGLVSAHDHLTMMLHGSALRDNVPATRRHVRWRHHTLPLLLLLLLLVESWGDGSGLWADTVVGDDGRLGVMSQFLLLIQCLLLAPALVVIVGLAEQLVLALAACRSENDVNR